MSTSSNTLSAFRTVIGANKGVPRSRIWIEGRRLVEAGFTPGTRYDRSHATPSGTGLYLFATPDGRYKVSGKGDKPIIDITGALVARLFPAPQTHVVVTFKPGSIDIESE